MFPFCQVFHHANIYLAKPVYSGINLKCTASEKLYLPTFLYASIVPKKGIGLGPGMPILLNVPCVQQEYLCKTKQKQR